MRTCVGALAALLLMGSPAVAEECALPSDAAAGLAQVTPEIRLAFLKETLVQEGRAANQWRWIWTGLLGAGAIAQIAITPALAKNDRPALYVGGAAMALAILPLQLIPPRVGKDGPAFGAKATAASPADTCALIREGEEILRRDAANEWTRTGWGVQLANGGYGFVIGLIVGLVTKEWLPATLSGLGAIIAGETAILTQPLQLTNAWRSYQAGRPTAPAATTPAVALAPTPQGIAFTGTF